jgi:hypothetical protein
LNNDEILETFRRIFDGWRDDLRAWAASNGFLTPEATVSDHESHDHDPSPVRDG